MVRGLSLCSVRAIRSAEVEVSGQETTAGMLASGLGGQDASSWPVRRRDAGTEGTARSVARGPPCSRRGCGPLTDIPAKKSAYNG